VVQQQPSLTPFVTPPPIAGPRVPTLQERLRAALQSGIRLLRGRFAGVLATRSLSVVAPGAGQLAFCVWLSAPPRGANCLQPRSGRNLLATGRRSFAAAGPGTIRVRPTRGARKRLRGRRRAAVTAQAVFRPAGGAAVVAQQRVALKK
jgi:hypothetical protein